MVTAAAARPDQLLAESSTGAGGGSRAREITSKAMPEKLFARRVDVGVGRYDISTEDLVVDAPVVVQDVTVVDDSGQEKRFLLLYDPERVPQMADALREAAERAKNMP